MTDHEAMLALAEPQPEPFRQVYPTAEDNARWQEWHDRYLAALTLALDRLQQMTSAAPVLRVRLG